MTTHYIKRKVSEMLRTKENSLEQVCWMTRITTFHCFLGDYSFCLDNFLIHFVKILVFLYHCVTTVINIIGMTVSRTERRENLIHAFILKRNYLREIINCIDEGWIFFFFLVLKLSILKMWDVLVYEMKGWFIKFGTRSEIYDINGWQNFFFFFFFFFWYLHNHPKDSKYLRK